MSEELLLLPALQLLLPLLSLSLVIENNSIGSLHTVHNVRPFSLVPNIPLRHDPAGSSVLTWGGEY